MDARRRRSRLRLPLPLLRWSFPSPRRKLAASCGREVDRAHLPTRRPSPVRSSPPAGVSPDPQSLRRSPRHRSPGPCRNLTRRCRRAAEAAGSCDARCAGKSSGFRPLRLPPRPERNGPSSRRSWRALPRRPSSARSWKALRCRPSSALSWKPLPCRPRPSRRLSSHSPGAASEAACPLPLWTRSLPHPASKSRRSPPRPASRKPRRPHRSTRALHLVSACHGGPCRRRGAQMSRRNSQALSPFRSTRRPPRSHFRFRSKIEAPCRARADRGWRSAGQPRLGNRRALRRRSGTVPRVASRWPLQRGP
jgi:hypothetical protein